MFNTCLNGDSTTWMKTITQPFADMIVADPPFNINYQYDIYVDNLSTDQYLDWCHGWISEASRLLLPHGNFLLCMGDEYVSDLDVIARREYGLHRKNWIIWHYGFGQSGKLNTRKGFTRSKTHILRFVKDTKNAYFNAAAVAVPSARATIYGDSRADPRGKCPNDVFMNKRIAGTHRERVPGIATQMPVELLQTWIKAMCRPDGCVFDPFPGSGASLVAAKSLGRSYMGVELSPQYTEMILNRPATVPSHNNT